MQCPLWCCFVQKILNCYLMSTVAFSQLSIICSLKRGQNREEEHSQLITTCYSWHKFSLRPNLDPEVLGRKAWKAKNMEVNPYKLDGRMYIALKRKKHICLISIYLELWAGCWDSKISKIQNLALMDYALLRVTGKRLGICMGSYGTTKWWLPNRNGGVDAGFLEPVKFELKHKGRKRFSQARDKVEGG